VQTCLYLTTLPPRPVRLVECNFRSLVTPYYMSGGGQFIGRSINTAGSATIGTGLTVTSGGATITAAGVAITAGGLAVVGGSATDTLKVTGNQGFYNTAPISKQTVSGSKASNAALASLMTALAALGLVTDSTS
jgi:hypothetical protein